MILRKTLALASLAATLFSAAAAHAAVTIYTDLGAFQAALTSSSLEDFGDDNFTPGWTADCPFCSRNSTLENLIDLAATAQQTILKFDAPITAWGANFDLSRNGFGRGLSFAIRMDDGFTTNVIPHQVTTSTGEFFGFISDEAFIRVFIGPGTGPCCTEAYNLDNMRWGQGVFGAAQAAVPEPGTWGLMIAGFGMAGAMLRRRRSELGAVAA